MPKKLTQDEVIKRFKDKHIDRYDYSKVEYVSTKVKVEIICKKHGSFLQLPDNHAKHGCTKCGRDVYSSKRVSNTHDFIKKAKRIHGETYDYSKVEYVKNNKNISIICKIHGKFKQTPANHLKGKGCNECGNIKISKSQQWSTDDYLQKVKRIHGDTYDYSKVEYEGCFGKVEIICKKHGTFKQTADGHLIGQGCPKCNNQVSKAELEILEIVKTQYDEDVKGSYRPKWLNKKELDIYSEKYKVAIEYCGGWFHGEHKKERRYHYEKWKLCQENGVRLITIFEFKWLENKDKYLSLLQSAFQANTKVYARQCDISHVDRKIAQEFYKLYHIEGSTLMPLTATHQGLYYKGGLLMVLSHGESRPQRNGVPKSTVFRVCTMSGCTVVGGLSRLSKLCPANTVYHSTNDTGSTWGNGKLSNLRYWWVKNSSALSRNYCQKQKLEKHFGDKLLDTDTEATYMHRQGYWRVWDSGLTRQIINETS